MIPEQVVLDEPRGNPCWYFQRGGGGALLRRSARWSRSRGLSSTPRPCLPGESSNPGLGWAVAAPGASCPPWRRRLGKVGALGACSSCRWASGVCRVDGVYIRCRFQIQPQVAQRRCFAMPRRVGALESGRKGIGFPFLAAAALLVPIRLVLEFLGPNLRHGAWQLLPFGDSPGGFPSSIGSLRRLRRSPRVCAPA